MIYTLAISLGFFGSLHCLTMCGPLIIGGIQSQPSNNKYDRLFQLLKYNISRSFAYALIGIGISSIGQLRFLGNFQQTLSLLGGAVLILLFLASLDIEKALFAIPGFKKIYAGLHRRIGQFFLNRKKTSVWIIGFFNGLLPCGLVYLALAASLMADNVWQSGLFMFLFGLSTSPILIGLVLGHHRISMVWKAKIANVIPIFQLVLGLILIYRGLFIHMPSELQFYYLIQNPIMCH
ncbi:sulfite exporter TauE/SafE family protein [Membranihabitans marinus]|uniref:sulfite exporter TauE/SafE family protein n=1 Tax=Membranihabitans marinus TaxID=1227546 RepID=UPI001F40B5B0|nr:sulfite exporter TauE/SafE family protein [Membranihabitans marinus]